AFFALRGWGTRLAVVGAAFCVFLATWLLHAYQAFWITGNLPLSLYDDALWLVVGMLVAWNLQRDLRRARPPAGRQEVTLGSAFALSLRVMGMFVLVSIFWTCWNTPAVAEYGRARLPSGQPLIMGLAALLGTALAVAVLGTAAQLLLGRLRRQRLLPLSLSP